MKKDISKLKDIIYLFNKFENAKFVFVKEDNGTLVTDKSREPIIGTLEDIYHNKNIDTPNMYVRHIASLTYYDEFSEEEYLTFFLEDKDEELEKDKRSEE
jgi:hypothetical protein